ncbi:hypothetical protein ACQUFY_25050 (plasmid) [Robbsia andropogonis]|uniref:hypothetical protein n=1 Tax=Robbsia andropogonis TaxID=28092 RepID=UPI003D263A2E
MDLRALFQSYKPALVRITVQTPVGDLSTGTAFHIGDGWLVTAAHVLRDGVVQEVVSEHASVRLCQVDGCRPPVCSRVVILIR